MSNTEYYIASSPIGNKIKFKFQALLYEATLSKPPPRPPYWIQDSAPVNRPSIDSSLHPILHDYTRMDDNDEPAFEIRYLGTELSIERPGTIAQPPHAVQAMNPESTSFEGNIQRTTTGLEANLQADPGSEGLRRRFT